MAAEQAKKHASILYAGQELAMDESLTSANGQYFLIMQGDGNFVEYKAPAGTAVWHSNTWKRGKRACLQRDGRLLVLSDRGTVEWASSDEPLKDDSYKLVLQNDGNAVIYDGADVPVWSNHVDKK